MDENKTIEELKIKINSLEKKMESIVLAQKKENAILHFKSENPPKYKVGESIGKITILEDIVDIFYTGGKVERRYKYKIMKGSLFNKARHVGDIVTTEEKYIRDASKGY